MFMRRLFEKGQYQEGLKRASDELNSHELPWLLGCAIFTGDWPKARSVRAKIPKDPQLLAPARYFEALGCLRRGEYAQARALMKENFKLRHPLRGQEEAFYIEQAPALYFYFHGDFARSRLYGERAFQIAEGQSFLWGELVARDVLAHAQFHQGEIRASFAGFDKVRELAKRLKNSPLFSAVEISRLKYGCQVGLWGADSVSHLQSSLAALEPEDTYSKAEFLLELSRQHILRGELQKAEQNLREAFPFVHQFQNRRQTARLNFRLAYLQFLRGQDLAALGILRSAMALVDSRVDHMILTEMAALAARLDERSGAPAPVISNAFWQKRIEARKRGEAESFPLGEDPLGDLLDRIHQDPVQASSLVKESRYWGLLPSLFRLQRHDRALLLGFFPKGLVLIQSGEVIVKNSGMTNLLARLIRSLAQGTCSKETLIQEIWGYTYDPLRHDPLLHRALTSLRKLLSPYEDWLQFDGDTYQLKPDLKIHENLSLLKTHFRNLKPEVKTRASPPAPIEYDLRLNHRQNLFLKSWEKNEPIDIRIYARSFQISLASATRDLTHLKENGYLQKIGRGRATKYIRGGIRASSESDVRS